MVNAGVMLPEN